MTPRRWRRRILTISSLDVAGSAVPRDLSIRLPQVQGRDIEQPIVLLPQEPRGGELHQRGRVRVCEGRGRDLETTATPLGEHISIQDGTVADREHIAGERLQIRGEVVRRRDRVLRVAHHATRDRAVRSAEHLPAAGVHDGKDPAAGESDRVRKGVEAREAQDHGLRDLGEGLRRLHADPQAGEQARADADRDATDLPEVDPRPRQEPFQGRGDRFLAGATEDLDPPEDLLLGTDRDGDLRGRRLDGDDDHRSAPHGPVTAPSSSARSSHEGPSAVIAMRRASEPPAVSSEVSSTRSRSSGKSSSTASPHSTISTQALSSNSSSARSTTSWTRSSRKTSTCAMGMRPVTYSRTSVKVGDATCSLAPSPLAIPRTSVVFPAPSSPVRTITSWTRSSSAMAAPTARVSSAVPVRSWSST